MTVTVAAWAKLTLQLRVTDVRADGYHEIDAEMVTLDLADDVEIDPDGESLEVVRAPAPGSPDLATPGHDTVPTGEDNLVRRALALAGCRAGVRIHKRIPPGAGLGGGSADAAAVLRWCGYTDAAAATAIGADVGFCLVGGRARVRGIGELVEPLPFESRVFTLALAAVGCPTAAVYRRWDEMGGPRGSHGNDLEPAAMSLVPELVRTRRLLEQASGTRPRLAGSGSTWFVPGAFPGPGRVVVHTVPAEV